MFITKVTNILLISALFVPCVSFALPNISSDLRDLHIKENGILYFEDKEKKYKIEDLMSAEQSGGITWLATEKNSLEFGYTKSAFWIKLSIVNSSDKDITFYIHEKYPNISYISFYSVKKGIITSRYRAGAKIKFNERPVRYRNFVFPASLASGEMAIFYLKYEAQGSMNIKPEVVSLSEFAETREFESIILWGLAGILLIMIVYNLVVFFSVRDRSYLYYVLFVVLYFFMYLSLTGLASQYLWPNALWWGTSCRPILLSLVVVTLVQFSRYFGRIKLYSVLIDRVQKIFVIAGVLSALAVPVINNYRITMPLSVVLAGIATIFALSAFFYMAFVKKSRQAMFFTGSFTLMFLGVLLYILKSLGEIPNNFVTDFSLHLGTSLQISFLSLGLADRINVMRRELKVLNTDLEQKVELRTAELRVTNEELEAINENLKKTRDSLWGEMELAKKIQTVLLPKRLSIPGYDLSAYMKPADEVGGDYYDVISFKEYNWIVIGDVSGHGVPAGLVMMMVQTSINTVLDNNPGIHPSGLLKSINATIRKNVQLMNDDKYMTLTVLSSASDGTFKFSGLHQDIMIYRAKLSEVELIDTSGIWIGILDDIDHLLEDNELFMEKGDVMLLYTDGITEGWAHGTIRGQRDIEKDMFGDQRLADALKHNGTEPVSIIKDRILEEFNRDYYTDDDVTIMVIKKV